MVALDRLRSFFMAFHVLLRHIKCNSSEHRYCLCRAAAGSCSESVVVMGVELRILMLPKKSSFRPSPDQAKQLIEVMENKNWLVKPGSAVLSRMSFQSSVHDVVKDYGFYAAAVGKKKPFAQPVADLLNRFAAQDLMLVWPVDSLKTSELRYPLDQLPAIPQAECYYRIEMHFADQYIYHTSETVEPFEPDPECECGESLEFDVDLAQDPFYAQRLACKCRECGKSFDPSQLVATGRDGWTGEEIQIRGGATYRFALVVDCGKCFGFRPVKIHDELKRLVEETFGCRFYEVSDAY